MFQGWASSRGHNSLEAGAFPTDLAEGKGLAGLPHYSAPQHPQNRLLLPLELCWSEDCAGSQVCLAMVKLGVEGWGDILFKWTCLFLYLFSRTSFSPARGQAGEVFFPKLFLCLGSSERHLDRVGGATEESGQKWGRDCSPEAKLEANNAHEECSNRPSPISG